MEGRNKGNEKKDLELKRRRQRKLKKGKDYTGGKIRQINPTCTPGLLQAGRKQFLAEIGREGWSNMAGYSTHTNGPGRIDDREYPQTASFMTNLSP